MYRLHIFFYKQLDFQFEAGVAHGFGRKLAESWGNNW